MQYQLLLILDYPKSGVIILEQARLYQTTQVLTIATICKKNIQLSELQLYTNNIARCLGIMFILSASRQDDQFNTLIKCSNLLQLYDLKITQQTSVIKSNLQAQPNIYSSSCIPPKHTQSGPKTTASLAPLNSSYVKKLIFPTQ